MWQDDTLWSSGFELNLNSWKSGRWIVLQVPLQQIKLASSLVNFLTQINLSRSTGWFRFLGQLKGLTLILSGGIQYSMRDLMCYDQLLLVSHFYVCSDRNFISLVFSYDRCWAAHLSMQYLLIWIWNSANAWLRIRSGTCRIMVTPCPSWVCGSITLIHFVPKAAHPAPPCFGVDSMISLEIVLIKYYSWEFKFLVSKSFELKANVIIFRIILHHMQCSKVLMCCKLWYCKIVFSSRHPKIVVSAPFCVCVWNYSNFGRDLSGKEWVMLFSAHLNHVLTFRTVFCLHFS